MENENKDDCTNKDEEYYFKVWKNYEDVAMHFNDLIIRLRIQSIGGVAALITILGVVSKTCNEKGAFNYPLAFMAIICLILFWIAIWILDMRYYNRLLEGSVKAILELEKNKETFLAKKNINLSHCIKDAFSARFEHEPEGIYNRAKTGRNLFYIVVFSALIIILLSVFYMYRCDCSQKEKVCKDNTALISKQYINDSNEIQK